MTRLEKLSSTIKQLVIIGTAVSAVFMTLFTTTVFLFADLAKSEARQFLGIDGLATASDLDSLREEVIKFTGRSGVLYMSPGSSYVEEPINWGDNIKAHLVVQSTERGAKCEFSDGQSLFSDQRNIPFPGPPVNLVRQIGIEPKELFLDLSHPVALVPGRIKFTISIRATCEGKTEFQETRPIYFYLEEKKT